MCATGLCGASIAKIGSVIAAGSLGGYKVMSMKSNISTSKKGKRKNITRNQKFTYKDSKGEEIDFEIKQKNKKITIKNGKKVINKTYKQLKSATNRYEKKIKECLKKGFNKC